MFIDFEVFSLKFYSIKSRKDPSERVSQPSRAELSRGRVKLGDALVIGFSEKFPPLEKNFN